MGHIFKAQTRSSRLESSFLAQLSQRQWCLHNPYLVTKSYILQAFNECDTYHTPCKWDKCMAD